MDFLLEEAKKRGLIPSDKMNLFDEAKSRGLLKNTPAGVTTGGTYLEAPGQPEIYLNPAGGGISVSDDISKRRMRQLGTNALEENVTKGTTKAWIEGKFRSVAPTKRSSPTETKVGARFNEPTFEVDTRSVSATPSRPFRATEMLRDAANSFVEKISGPKTAVAGTVPITEPIQPATTTPINKGARFQKERFTKDVRGVSETPRESPRDLLGPHLPGITKEGTQNLKERMKEFAETPVLEKTDTGFKVNPKSTEYLGPMVVMAQPLTKVMQTPWWSKIKSKSGQTVVEDPKMLDKPMSGEFALQRIKDSGVAKAEIEMTGLDKFLKEQKTVTPKQVTEFSEKNKVEIKPIVYVEKEFALEQQAKYDKLTNKIREQVAKNNIDYPPGRGSLPEDRVYELMQLTGERDKIEAQRQIGSAKFSSWQTPGGEDYKETLLQLPLKGDPKWKIYDPNKPGKEPILTFDNESAAQNYVTQSRERFNRQLYYEPALGGAHFTQSHWDEPNIIAHIRSNERTLPNGEKAYHIEEFQSDWDTASRPSEKNYIPSRAVDRHPLVDNWQNLVARKSLKDAVESGADRITWVTGKQTSDRYDLSRHLEGISYAEYVDEKGIKTYSIGTYPKGGGITDDNWEELGEDIPIDKLGSYMGKDLANKIINGEGVLSKAAKEDPTGSQDKTISGLDLKVGGEWATKLYDESMVNRFNKLGKKWGVKVEDVEITGFPRYDVIDDAREGIDHWALRRWDSPSNIKTEEWYQSEEGAQKIADKYNSGLEWPKVHSLSLTPEMKADIKQQEFTPFGDFEPILKETKYTPVTPGVSEEQLKKEAEMLGLDNFGFMGNLKNGHPIYTARDPKTGSNVAPGPGETLEGALKRVKERFKNEPKK